MKYIECPKQYRRNPKETSLFLGGGITSCPQWQPLMVEALKDTSLTLLNPRRAAFDVTNPNIELEQITWEYKHMDKATAILFWFPCETLCPITLFELGKWVGTDKKLFIGHHPDYQRKRDIRIQVDLVRGKRQNICDSLESLADQVKRWA